MKTRNIEPESCRRLVYQIGELKASARNLAAMRIIERGTSERPSGVLQSWHMSLLPSHLEDFSADVRESAIISICDEVRKLASVGDIWRVVDYADRWSVCRNDTYSVTTRIFQTVLKFVEDLLTAGRRKAADKFLMASEFEAILFQMAVNEMNYNVLAWYVEMHHHVAPTEDQLSKTLVQMVKEENWEMFQYLSDNLSNSVEKHFLARNFELQTIDGQITPVGRYLKTCVYGIHDDRLTDWFDEREEDRYYEIRPVLGRVLRKEKIGGDEYFERFAKYAQIPTILPVLESGIMTSVNVLEDFWRSSTIVEQPRRLRRI